MTYLETKKSLTLKNQEIPNLTYWSDIGKNNTGWTQTSNHTSPII